jgi:outer membrane lipoprotein-sorting protein
MYTTEKLPDSNRSPLARLAVAVFFGIWVSAAGVSNASADPDLASAQKIADHFSQVRTMTGEFVQFGPQGQQTGGNFYLERPGKIRFNYEPPSAYRVVSDGKSIVIFNTKLHTNDLYSLSATPLKLLLADHIDLSGSQVSDVTQDKELTTITMTDKSILGNARITMMFDPQTYDLRQWTVTDAQGKDTTVMIFNVQSGVKLDPSLFEIDYAKIAENTTYIKGK